MHRFHHGLGEVFSALAALGVNLGDAYGTCSAFVSRLGDGGQFCIGVGSKPIDGYDHGYAKRRHVSDVTVKVGLRSHRRCFDVLRF